MLLEHDYTNTILPYLENACFDVCLAERFDCGKEMFVLTYKYLPLLVDSAFRDLKQTRITTQLSRYPFIAMALRGH